jgi:hypothetical protein
MTSQTINLIQSKLDSNKELIGDGEYLEICNLMKQLYDEKENEKLHTKMLYKVTFIMPKITKNIDDTETEFDIHMKVKTVIIQLAKIQYNWIIEEMQNSDHGLHILETNEVIGLKIPFGEECLTNIFYTDNNDDDGCLLVESKEYCITSIIPVPTSADNQ